MNWTLILILFIAALIGCVVGFKEFVWFMSVGYGLAVAAVGLTLGVVALATDLAAWNIITILQCIAFVIYGVRLGGFLLVREIKNAAYKKTLQEAAGKEPPIFVKAIMWLMMGVLYLLQPSGVIFRMMNAGLGKISNEVSVVSVIGLIIMIGAIVLEAVSDKQKSAQKAVDPNMVATQGLFKIVRCPNYLGEILFWVGTFISGIGAYQGVLQWLLAIAGLIMIVYIMFNGAQRLEKRQYKRLAGDPRYEEYVAKTPIIIPFIPLYHLYDPKKDAAKEAAKAAKKAGK
ncbi:MAG: DUF1295 domain-containing protein [Oscillospiraceae bacterium]|nr:DUF1295 domain-containing protein [Oscillospiraceae bacterium]